MTSSRAGAVQTRAHVSVDGKPYEIPATVTITLVGLRIGSAPRPRDKRESPRKFVSLGSLFQGCSPRRDGRCPVDGTRERTIDRRI